MTRANTLDLGRESFARQAWGDAYDQLSAANQEEPLGPDDLERLAIAAYLTGRDAEQDDALARAYHVYLIRGEVQRAVRCAFWLGFGLVNRGETARGGGWLARARRLLDEGQHDCVEQGYLLLPVALQSMGEGEIATAYATFDQAAKIGDRFRDPDLMTLGRLGRGGALIHMGNIGDGTALLDEAMVSVTAGEVSPIVTGIVYCAVIEICQGDVRSAAGAGVDGSAEPLV